MVHILRKHTHVLRVSNQDQPRFRGLFEVDVGSVPFSRSLVLCARGGLYCPRCLCPGGVGRIHGVYVGVRTHKPTMEGEREFFFLSAV